MNRSVELAKKRIAEMRAELAELETFVRVAAKLESAEDTYSTDDLRRPPLQDSCNLAERVLAASGPLHLRDLVARMIEQGWRSSGNRRLDYKNMHNNLSAQRARFRNLGRSVFSLAPKRGAQASVASLSRLDKKTRPSAEIG
jgi:hypothetical protein